MNGTDIGFNFRSLSSLTISLYFLLYLISGISCLLLLSACGFSDDRCFYRQFWMIVIFIPVIVVVPLIPVRAVYLSSYYIYFFCLFMLIVAYVIGHTSMGAQRWVRVLGINFQPAEFMKVGTVLALARYFYDIRFMHIPLIRSIIVPVILVFLPVFLILKQPNLGTAAILVCICCSIFFISGVRIWKFIVVGIGATITLPLIWWNMYDYQKNRIITFINPDLDLLGRGYNIAQSKIAIGSGGLFGKGWMAGTQNNLNFLPETHTDFIFTILAEEFGFLGCCFVIFLYFYMIFVCYRVAFIVNNQFSRVICVGTASFIFTHVFINVGMVSGLLPVVGTPIPFLSYGGSNLLVSTVMVSLVINMYYNRYFTTLRR